MTVDWPGDPEDVRQVKAIAERMAIACCGDDDAAILRWLAEIHDVAVQQGEAPGEFYTSLLYALSTLAAVMGYALAVALHVDREDLGAAAREAIREACALPAAPPPGGTEAA